MKVLVLNCGSSSLKYQLIDMSNEESMVQGLVERIGIEGSALTQKTPGKGKHVINTEIKDHKDAIKLVLEALVNEEYGVIKSMDEISAVGHRVVHGGEKYSESVLITDEVLDSIRDCIALAPLHNPPNIIGIEACRELMPNVPMVAVFDTAFHQTMPKNAYICPLPYELYEKYGVRKYGAHGTSHDYVSKVASEMLGKKREELNIITCHLGQGASICAIKDGKCIDTSMGLTPLGGIAMVTRSGDLDPSVVTYIMEKEEITPQDMTDILNKKSGISALCQMAPDFQVIEKASLDNDGEAVLAIKKFSTTVAEYIARYAAVLEGVDVIVFTGGIGENQKRVRKSICEKLRFMGVILDEAKNDISGKDIEITDENSNVRAFVIQTNEELEIAKETLKLVL